MVPYPAPILTERQVQLQSIVKSVYTVGIDAIMFLGSDKILPFSSQIAPAYLILCVLNGIHSLKLDF